MQEPLVKTHVQGSQYQFFQVLSPVTSMATGQVSFPRGCIQLEVEYIYMIQRTQAILDQKNLTGLAGGAREGQNMAHSGHFNGKCAKMQCNVQF